MPAASLDAAGSASGLLVALSPGIALVLLRGGLPGIDTASLSLASPHGPILPPMSWQAIPGTDPALSLLLLRAQPGLAAGLPLEAVDEAGGRLRLLPEAAHLAEALGGLAPAAILRVVGFLASRGRRLLRGVEDPAFAACCHAVAEHRVDGDEELGGNASGAVGAVCVRCSRRRHTRPLGLTTGASGRRRRVPASGSP